FFSPRRRQTRSCDGSGARRGVYETGFIRRPFIMANAMVGVISGLVAGGVLSAFLALCASFGMPELTVLIGWPWMGVIDGSLMAGGALICALAALLATTRHLRQDYGELFK
ncbi:MAG: hypothetical protein K2J34_06520, partial [Muribaculaceae bacterium]|nr:hypothetical protein [Muribaculaceae bacterium]